MGGNVSTNAGGLRYLRYGSLHGSVLGLEVVTGTGEVLDLMSTLRKDNVGFDLKQLFIGSEGTLGIVTKVAIQAVARPSSINVALLGLPSFAACTQALRDARSHLGEILSAVEFVDSATMDITMNQLFPGQTYPLASKPPFYVTVETGGSNAAHDNDKLQSFLQHILGGSDTYGGDTDGVVASHMRQAKQLWRLREEASVAISQRGHVYKYDLSFPIPHMYELVEVMRARVEEECGWRAAQDVRVVGYGHLGDGNIHLNISTPSRGQAYHGQLLGDIEPYVFDWTLKQHGSVSAEHGIGQAKAKLLSVAKPSPVVAAMRNLKAVFDPKGILNPGKVLTALK